MPHILNSEQVFAVDAHAPPAVMPGLRHSVVLKERKLKKKRKTRSLKIHHQDFINLAKLKIMTSTLHR